jgi:hypothetical protein
MMMLMGSSHAPIILCLVSFTSVMAPSVMMSRTE